MGFNFKEESKTPEMNVSPDIEAIHIEQRKFHSIERSQYRKDQRNGKVLYSSLDTEKMTGESMIPDKESISVEDAVELAILCDQVKQAVSRLSKPQRELIVAVFFEGKTETQIAKEMGITQQGVSKKVRLALARIKKFLKF